MLNFVMLSANMLNCVMRSVATLNLVILRVKMLSVAVHMFFLSEVTLNFLLSAAMLSPTDECSYAEFYCADCHYTDCRGTFVKQQESN